MFGIIKCLISGHDWNVNDYNEKVKQYSHKIGEEVFIKCRRCKGDMVGIEKLSDGGIKWNAYDKEAILYEVNPDYIKREGSNHGIEKFREDNK